MIYKPCVDVAHKALIENHFMSGAVSHERKMNCKADAFMNERAELLLLLATVSMR